MKTLLLAALAIAAAVLAAWLLDLFTWTGIAAAFWPWADTTSLRWPLGTRLVWWLATIEAAVVPVMALVWREGRLECPTTRDLWLAAHVSLVQRLTRRGRFAFEGLRVAVEQHRRHRPVVVEQAPPSESVDAAQEKRAA